MPGARRDAPIAPSSSAWLTPGFSAGESRNQAYHTAAQITPDRAEHEEGRAPAVADLDRHDQQRRDRAANLARHQQHAGHARALRRREPARDDDGGVRKRAGFAGAEAEPGEQQQVVVRHRAGQRRERGPPQHHARQHAARADAIAQRAGGDLEQAVGQREHRRHPAPADRDRCPGPPACAGPPRRCRRDRCR